jgi:mannose-6-phosphate isomerase-like protein (cupin superfamily)
MRKTLIGFLAAAVLCSAVALAQGASGAQGRSGAGAGTVILEKAPTDHAIAIPKEKLTQYLKDMDAKKLSTLRMIEGGKHNVNIRRITSAEPTALVHPNTIDVWVVLEGGGTLTSGGKLTNGKIVGGVTNPLKVGDLVFIPANLPHGVSGVSPNITWLNVRWDVDWPASAKLGAGNAPPTGAPAAAPAGGGRGRGGANPGPLEYAQTDHAVYIPKEKLDGYLKDMDAKNTGTLRMIEGGHFNVNIRRIKQPSTEFHEITNDTWVVIEGGGTANTAYKTDKGDEHAGLGARVAGTGVSTPAKLGDVFYVPANLTHGYSTVNGVVAWLNIRWDVNWDTK